MRCPGQCRPGDGREAVAATGWPVSALLPASRTRSRPQEHSMVPACCASRPVPPPCRARARAPRQAAAIKAVPCPTCPQPSGKGSPRDVGSDQDQRFLLVGAFDSSRPHPRRACARPGGTCVRWPGAVRAGRAAISGPQGVALPPSWPCVASRDPEGRNNSCVPWFAACVRSPCRGGVGTPELSVTT